MSNTPSPDADNEHAADFRWQSFFHRSTEPLFLLNRGRRILFVNAAWESLTGLSAGAGRGLVCTRRPIEAPTPLESLARVLCPPPEVLQGHSAQVRRILPGPGNARRYWDIEFLPLQGPKGLLGVLGKIIPQLQQGPRPGKLIPDKLAALRHRVVQRFSLALWASQLPAFERIIDQVRVAAQTSATVTIFGELGTGKETLARTIHQQSANAERAFVVLDASTLPAQVLCSVLFGDEGLLCQKTIAVIYFREPARLPRDLQARLQETLAEPDPRRPRIMTGSSVNLTEEVRAGRLIEEFRCRISTLTLELPPLRERVVDLLDLVKQMLAGKRGAEEQVMSGVTAEALELLRVYSWPGNLRELSVLLSQACQRAKGAQLTAGDLPASLRLAVKLDQQPSPAKERPIPLDPLLEEAERRLIRLALERAKGNKKRAADLLNIPRPRLFRRMELLGMEG